jgi:hypothetical protein
LLTVESSKKLRSFSVQNTLTDKLSSYGTSAKGQIPSSLAVTNMNASFDNGVAQIGGQKKIKIPKLNL